MWEYAVRMRGVDQTKQDEHADQFATYKIGSEIASTITSKLYVVFLVYRARRNRKRKAMGALIGTWKFSAEVIWKDPIRIDRL
jgi:hypothetical protein